MSGIRQQGNKWRKLTSGLYVPPLLRFAGHPCCDPIGCDYCSIAESDPTATCDSYSLTFSRPVPPTGDTCDECKCLMKDPPAIPTYCEDYWGRAWSVLKVDEDTCHWTCEAVEDIDCGVSSIDLYVFNDAGDITARVDVGDARFEKVITQGLLDGETLPVTDEGSLCDLTDATVEVTKSRNTQCDNQWPCTGSRPHDIEVTFADIVAPDVEDFTTGCLQKIKTDDPCWLDYNDTFVLEPYSWRPITQDAYNFIPSCPQARHRGITWVGSPCEGYEPLRPEWEIDAMDSFIRLSFSSGFVFVYLGLICDFGNESECGPKKWYDAMQVYRAWYNRFAPCSDLDGLELEALLGATGPYWFPGSTCTLSLP